MKKGRRLVAICCMVIGLYLLVICMPLLYIFLDSTGVIDNIIYGKEVPSKGKIFQILQDNQNEFELLVGDVENILIESIEGGEYALTLDGRREYAQKGLKSELLKQYPIKTITARNPNGILKVSFKFEIQSDSITGIYYVSDGKPSFWSGDRGGEENNGVYIQKGSRYNYETEQIIGNWYYYHVTMW